LELKKKREHKELVEKLKSDQIIQRCADVSIIDMCSKRQKKGKNIPNCNSEKRVTGNGVGVKHKVTEHKEKQKSLGPYKKNDVSQEAKMALMRGGWSSLCGISW